MDTLSLVGQNRIKSVKSGPEAMEAFNVQHKAVGYGGTWHSVWRHVDATVTVASQRNSSLSHLVISGFTALTMIETS